MPGQKPFAELQTDLKRVLVTYSYESLLELATTNIVALIWLNLNELDKLFSRPKKNQAKIIKLQTSFPQKLIDLLTNRPKILLYDFADWAFDITMLAKTKELGVTITADSPSRICFLGMLLDALTKASNSIEPINLEIGFRHYANSISNCLKKIFTDKRLPDSQKTTYLNLLLNLIPKDILSNFSPKIFTTLSALTDNKNVSYTLFSTSWDLLIEKEKEKFALQFLLTHMLEKNAQHQGPQHSFRYLLINIPQRTYAIMPKKNFINKKFKFWRSNTMVLYDYYCQQLIQKFLQQKKCSQNDFSLVINLIGLNIVTARSLGTNNINKLLVFLKNINTPTLQALRTLYVNPENTQVLTMTIKKLAAIKNSKCHMLSKQLWTLAYKATAKPHKKAQSAALQAQNYNPSRQVTFSAITNAPHISEDTGAGVYSLKEESIDARALASKSTRSRSLF